MNQTFVYKTAFAARIDALAKQLMRHINATTDVKLHVTDCGKGAAVVAIRRRTRRGDSSIEWTVAAALCSPHDEFDLLYGITRALGRLHKDAIPFEPMAGEVLSRVPLSSALRAVRSRWQRKTKEGSLVRRWPSWATVPPPPQPDIGWYPHDGGPLT